MKIFGFIFARGGSKGVPKKNIKPLCGKPLIGWAIEAGLKSGRLDRLTVSTDSPEIAAVAREFGAETPFMRPPELAADTADEWLAWRHAINFYRNRGVDFDVFVSLPATAPLRTVQNIHDCIDKFLEGDSDAVITCADPHVSPYFNMLQFDSEGYARLAIPGYELVPRRQDVPKVYDMTCVAYVTSPDYILNAPGLMTGRLRAVNVGRVNAIDIDEPIDFEMAEFFMRKRLEEEGRGK